MGLLGYGAGKVGQLDHAAQQIGTGQRQSGEEARSAPAKDG
jgi:hypothetical protein